MKKKNAKIKIVIVRYRWKNMLKFLTGEASKGYKNKNQRWNDKNPDKYTLLKRFHHDHQLQVYMYALMYFNPKTMPV